MIVIVGDQLVDVSIRLKSFPLEARQMQKAEAFLLGPGGAGNVAIASARLGHAVSCLAEIGNDELGEIVRRGLGAEGVDTTHLAISAGAGTPVAGVLVDAAGEPAYLGYPGTLRMTTMPPGWGPILQSAEAVYADGWAEGPTAAGIVVKALRRAHANGVPTFFDPGPGNPSLDNEWHRLALAETRVAILNESEVRRISGQSDLLQAARAMAGMGPEAVFVKRGANGCLAIRGQEVAESPGFRVPVVDTTGAGDSVGAAVMSGWLARLALPDLATLANAMGAAKVQKKGTGRSMPTRDEVRAVLRGAGHDPDRFL
ncbi:MAG: carbohydrate kinase family protein [Anaerolineales bacterium]